MRCQMLSTVYGVGRVFACHGRKLQLTNEWMQDNSAFVIGSIIGNRPLTTARQFAELTNCHNELRTWLFCSWPAIAARANSRTYARNACTTKPLPRYPPERGGDGRKEREGERGCFKGGGDGSMDQIHPLLKNEMAAIRNVSRGFASIGRAQDRRRLWWWLLY